MDSKLVSVLVGLVGGAVGYLLTIFFMRPILRYGELRQQILSDLIFYAQVVNADGLNEEMKKRYYARVEANRRHSADLTACYFELPWVYRQWLRIKGHCPETASVQLMGFSNTTDYDKADKRIQKIKECLGFKTEVV